MCSKFLDQIYALCRGSEFLNSLYYFFSQLGILNSKINEFENIFTADKKFFGENISCSLEEGVNLYVNKMFYEINNSNFDLGILTNFLSNLKDFNVDFENLFQNWNFLEKSEESFEATIELMRQQKDNFMKALIILERKPINDFDIKFNALELKPIFDMFELIGIKPSSPIFVEDAFREKLYLLEDYYYYTENNKKGKITWISEKFLYKNWFDVPLSKLLNIAKKIARYGVMINLKTKSILFDSGTEYSRIRLFTMIEKDSLKGIEIQDDDTFQEIAEKMVQKSFDLHKKKLIYSEYSEYLYIPPLIDAKCLLNWYLMQRVVYNESQSLYDIILDQKQLELISEINELDLENFKKVIIRVVLCCFATGKLFLRKEVYAAAVEIAKTGNIDEPIFDVYLWNRSNRLKTQIFFQELISKKVGKYPSRYFTQSSVKKQFDISDTISGGFIYPLIRYTKSKLNEFKEYYSNLFSQITSTIATFLSKKYSTIADIQAYFEEEAYKTSLEMSKKLPDSESNKVSEVVRNSINEVVGDSFELKTLLKESKESEESLKVSNSLQYLFEGVE
jgi:hypothetical protein